MLACLTQSQYHSHQVMRLEALAEDVVAATESLRRRSVRLEGLQAELNSIRSELYATPYLANHPFEQIQSPVGEVTGYSKLDHRIIAPSEYSAFEDMFRGPQERVTDLQRPYVGLVAEHQPVLDVGCGRGEFLALLASEGIAASGVDSDGGMVARCEAQGLAAVQADGTEYLEGLENGALGTVFCAQVVEHLQEEQLRRLLGLARRKLKPGGLFIAETINPHSIPALKTFWVDLTHQHPIFPEVALALCAIAGFCPGYVFAPGYQNFEQAKFESTSYAVVASSPAPVGNGPGPAASNDL